jgi:hypothetical protein
MAGKYIGKGGVAGDAGSAKLGPVNPSTVGAICSRLEVDRLTLL